jgi:hypothetical protein
MSISQEEAAALFLPVIRDLGIKFKKFSRVLARSATVGEVIVTETKDGKETQNIAKEGDFVIKNPGGEEYIIAGETFKKRYDYDIEGETPFCSYPGPRPGEWDWYFPTGCCNAAEFNASAMGLESPFYFVAAWGEDMVLKDGDMIVTIDDKEVYRIARAEFEETYRPF